MLKNLLDLKVKPFLNMFLNSTKPYINLNKLLKLGMKKISSFLLKNGFEQGKVDTILFHRIYDSQFLLVQVYVDNIIFGATNKMLYEDFSKLMQTDFKMSIMGELEFFLGLHLKQTP